MNSPEWEAFIESLPRETVPRSTNVGPHKAQNEIGVFRLENGCITPLVALPHGQDKRCLGCIADMGDLNISCRSLPYCDDVKWAPLTPATYAQYIAHKISGGSS